MKLPYKTAICAFVGALESVGLSRVVYSKFQGRVSFPLIVVLSLVVFICAFLFLYLTISETIEKLQKNLSVKKFIFSLSYLLFLGFATFCMIPLISLIPGGLFLKVISITGISLFFTSVYIYIFSICIGSKGEIDIDKKSNLITFLICVFSFFSVCMIYLMSYYPGVMSADSFAQWRQMENFKFSDWHPAFLTLINWVLTRIWHSPAVIGIFNSLLFSLAFSAMVLEYKKSGVKKAVLYPIAAIFIFNPVNGIMSVTIWKDITYSILMLGLTFLAAKIFSSEGRWLHSPLNAVLLVITLVCGALVRHNGIIPVGIMIICMIVFYLRYWKSTVVIAAITVAVIMLIKGPVYDILNVAPINPFQVFVNPIMQVGGIVTGNGVLTEKEEAVVNKILPIKEWDAGYDKYSIVTLAATKGFNMGFFKNNRNDFLKAWAGMALRNPGLAIRAYLDRTAIIWRIINPKKSYVYTNSRNIIDNNYNISMKPVLPFIKKYTDMILRLLNNKYFYILWKPAFFMLVILLFGLAAVIKNGAKWMFVLIPVLGNTLGLLIVTTSAQPRYYYATLVIAPFVIAAAFAPGKNKNMVIEKH